jgi:hypothetical protein
MSSRFQEVLNPRINTFMKTYYLIYKITNLINEKIYVGAHRTTNINDTYMGSGYALNEAFEKYGKSHFQKEIMHIFDNETDMWDMERSIVTEEFCSRQDTYNIKVGGYGGWNHLVGTPEHIEASRKGGKKARAVLLSRIKEEKCNNTEWYIDLCEKRVQGNRIKNSNSWVNHTEEESNCRLSRLKESSKGSNNSQFGRYWISNIETKEVRRISSDDEIPQGWVRGKKGVKKNTTWVNNGTQEMKVLPNLINQYLMEGFIKGRLKSSMPNK